MYWYTQGLFAAEQACRRRFWFRLFLFSRDIVSFEMAVLGKLRYTLVFLQFFESTKSTRNSQPFNKWSSFVLSSHLDPICNQHDIQYLLMFVNLLCICCMSGTVPTYWGELAYNTL